MDDMLSALEKGNKDEQGQPALTPRAKEKIYKNQYGSLQALGNNKVAQDKYMKH